MRKNNNLIELYHTAVILDYSLSPLSLDEKKVRKTTSFISISVIGFYSGI